MPGKRPDIPNPLGMESREEIFIGQELHDTVCQTLQGISLLTGSLVRAQDRGKNIAREDLEKIRTNVDAASEQLRLIFEGSILTHQPQRLMPMLERLAKSTTPRVTCSFTAENAAAVVEGTTAYALYRTARIFVQIAIRKAEARRITLRLKGPKKISGLTLSFEGNPVLSASFESSDEKMLEDAMRLGSLKWRIETGTQLECFLQ